MFTKSHFSLLLSVALTLTVAWPTVAQVPDPAEATAGLLQGSVRGRFQGEVRPLAFAVVEAWSGGVRRSALADDAGRYVLPRLGPGEVRLRVTQPGYESLTLIVLVPARDSVTVDFELEGAPLALPRVEVRSDPRALAAIPGRDAPEPPIAELEMQTLDLGPGVSEAGLANVVSALPGNDPSDATDVLYMRGSTTDLKLVLLDGVPVYTPFHVAGLMRSFEPGVLDAADLHIGGAPARFDGGLTHILELRTRTARRDRVRFSGSADLLAASAAVEAPLGDRAGFILAGRSLHDLGSTTLGGSRPYGYQDALFTLSAEPAAGHGVRATGFWNAESVLLDADLASDDARWSNRAGSLAYRADLGGTRLELTAGASRYNAHLPLQPSPQASDPLPPALVASAVTERARVVAEATWGAPSTPIRAGLSYEQIDAAFEARALAGGSRAESHGSTEALGAFVDVTRPLVPGLTIRAGLRADHFTGRITRLAPRAALTWELGPEALLTVAAGRYHQPTRTPDVEVERTLAEVAGVGVTSAELLPIATANHVVLSLDQRLGGTVRLGLQGFWKEYEGLPSAVDQTVRSSGLDVRVMTAGERGAAWLGYGLSWFWSTVDLSGRASEFAGRHLLSAGLSGQLGGPLQGEVRIAYGAGLPYTSIPFHSGDATAGVTTGTPGVDPILGPVEARGDTPLVGGLDETFLRLDVELYALFEPRWGGRTLRLRPYVRILNALDRRDALFYTFQPWRSETVKPLAERPILPLLGVAVSF